MGANAETSYRGPDHTRYVITSKRTFIRPHSHRIVGILERTEEIYETSGAKRVKEKVDDLSDDAREAWETSQNPWVYRVSSVYDTFTAESESTVAVRELRELDPEFTLEDWRADVKEVLLPQFMKWFLEGDIDELEPHLGEAVYKKLAAEIAARKKEGVQIDTNVLGIMNSEILACEVSQSFELRDLGIYILTQRKA